MAVFPDSRLSIITVGVKDRTALTAFYEDVIGFKKVMDEGMTLFDMGGFMFGLWDEEKLAGDAGVEHDRKGAFKGVALAYNAPSIEAVDEIFASLADKGVTISTKPHKAFWGGYSGYFTDPEGNAWEVAFNPFWKLDEAGRVVLPAGAK